MQEHIYTISELNQQVRNLLESNFSLIWVEGEISNFVCPSSGHWYFSLKDKNAQVRCAMFRGANSRLKFQPENGMHVIVFARVSLYEGRGDFQLIVEKIEEVGFGRLQRAFEELKQKLSKEGLFDEKYKQPLPRFPQQIGVITSPTGAAIRDILSVLKRRFPLAPIVIYPTLVQGNDAAPKIVKAIQVANERHECDILLVARGGGSIEDLWPFNEETVARAIFASTIPIVAGIGHEIDFTIADFVADHRAPTPSAAAEFVSPNQHEILQQLSKTEQRLCYAINKHHDHQQIIVSNLSKRIKRCHPIQQLQDAAQNLDYLEQNLIAAQLKIIETKQNKLQLLSRALNAISPLATLKRGYAIITNQKNSVIQKSNMVKIGEKINAKLATGKLQCTVEQIYEND
ncbi:MAG: exodeoxyribonuclease VII large subunit [Gammaproteobacteria bacterium]|jgi:exodeoxyribonuclease VII large subunit